MLAFYSQPIGGEGRFIGLENYRTLLHDRIWWLSFKNTLVYTIFGVGFKTAVGLAFALILHQELRGTHHPARALFLATDGEPGAPPVVVLGDSIWRRRFGADPDIVGRSIDIDGTAYAVVGVAPPKVSFPTGSELWAPLVLAGEAAAIRDRHYVGAFGRLVDGVDLDGAAARYALVAEQIAAQHPEEMRDRGTATRTLPAGFRDVGAVPIFTLFQASALFVLLIGWINVANLVLARGQERQRELAVLDALGAGRWRVVRLLVCAAWTWTFAE